MARIPWQSQIQDGDFSNVMRLVHLAYRLTSTEQEAIRAELVRTRRTAYEDALTELATEAGCDRRGRLGEGVILSELNAQSAEDAAAIVNTFNTDLVSAIKQIKAAVPTANRNTYAKRLAEWETSRAEWKDAQIASNTTLTARQAAQRDFMQNNLVEVTVELVGPKPAAEPVCQAALDMGRIPLEQANGIQMPAHLNCIHTWALPKIKKISKNECLDLWLGA